MTMKLEATQTRKEVYNACRTHDEHCTGCPFRYACEDHFPEIDHRVAANDLIPADYSLTLDGQYFVAEVR